MLSTVVVVALGLLHGPAAAPKCAAVHSARSLPRMAANSARTVDVRTAADACIDASASDDDWSEVDAWLAEGSHERLRQYGPPDRPRLQASTKGHLHEHFFHHNSKMREWGAIGASERLTENVQRLGYARPSTPQAGAFAAIMRGDNTLIADANGMGKTLAFVAPLVQRLWEWEERDGRTPPGQVRAIIVVPTNDLAQQVLELARDVAKRSIRASIATGEHSWRTQRDRMAGGLDLLVATMGRLVGHAAPRGMEPSFDLSGVRQLVVDEASSLYQGRAPSWLSSKAASERGGRRTQREPPMLQELPLGMWTWLRGELAERTASSGGCSTVVVTSALPEGVEAQIRDDLGGGADGRPMTARIGRGLHTTRAGVEIELVDCSGGKSGVVDGIFEAKLAELRDALSSSQRVLVLCNNAASCERIERALRSAPFECGDRVCPVFDIAPTVLPFHGSLTAERRTASLAAFRRPTPNRWEKSPNAPDAEPPVRVLVATGRAVRGLELSAGADKQLDHVVLFDFAPDAKAYLSRVGCATRGDTAAVGRTPTRVTALAGGRSQLAFAKAMLSHDAKGSAHDLRGVIVPSGSRAAKEA